MYEWHILRSYWNLYLHRVVSASRDDLISLDSNQVEPNKAESPKANHKRLKHIRLNHQNLIYSTSWFGVNCVPNLRL